MNTTQTIVYYTLGLLGALNILLIFINKILTYRNKQLRKKLGFDTFEGLTKENFFDALTYQYPDAMHEFTLWVDEYKFKVNWNVLFHWTPANKPPKFHELPIEMQVGVLLRYIGDKHNNYGNYMISNYHSSLNIIKDTFKHFIQTRQSIIEISNKF